MHIEGELLAYGALLVDRNYRCASSLSWGETQKHQHKHLTLFSSPVKSLLRRLRVLQTPPTDSWSVVTKSVAHDT